MKVHRIIQQNILDLVSLCEKHRVDKLYAFGSLVSDKFNESSSDIDLIVILEEMPPIQKGENLLSLWADFESLFGRKVDLLTDKPIKNPYFRKNVEDTKQLIYDRQSKKIPV